MSINSFAPKYIGREGAICRVFVPKTACLPRKEAAKKFFKKKVKFVLTCATGFGTICKSAIGHILPYLRDIAMNREIAQVSEVTFGEYVRTSGG
ncbi:hypothetical protein [Oscillibacter sp. ER4]|uniref:hypothetical protein n=1 Tax=Oscillibacter sp. ER4 TaxID=1519439 RepID=UPI0012E0404A|nr:hypothetical protein [Oscillibacter sp. ER4]